MRPRRLVVLVAAGVVPLAFGSASLAQHVSPDRPLTVVVGGPAGAAVTDRLDARRSNRSPLPLPTHALRIVWTRKLHHLAHPPLVLDDGAVAALTEEGDLFVLNPDGTDRSRVFMGPGPLTAPTLSTDGTVVAVNAAGDAVGVARATVRFRTHVADVHGAETEVVRRKGGRRGMGRHGMRGPPPEPEPPGWTAGSPLSLDDGGVVVALDRHLATLDAEGAIRERVLAPQAVAFPLLATPHSVVMVADGGEVYEWTPGDAVHRRGTYGSPPEGALVLESERELVAVSGAHVTALNLVTGELRERAASDRGVFVGVPALTDQGLFLQEMTPNGTRSVRFDRDGHLDVVATLTPQGAQALGDGGTLVFVAPSHTALAVDPAGALLYATVDGRIGVATPTEKTELGDLICGRPEAPSVDSYGAATRTSAGFAGLVPAGPRAFVVACEGGEVAFVRGD